MPCATEPIAAIWAGLLHTPAASLVLSAAAAVACVCPSRGTGPTAERGDEHLDVEEFTRTEEENDDLGAAGVWGRCPACRSTRSDDLAG